MTWQQVTTADRLRAGDRVALHGRAGSVDLTTIGTGAMGFTIRIREEDGSLHNVSTHRDRTVALLDGSTERHRGVEFDTNGNHGYPYRAWCTCGWRSPGYAAFHAARDRRDGHLCDAPE